MAIHVVGYEEKYRYEGNNRIVNGRSLLNEYYDTADYKSIRPGDLRQLNRNSPPVEFIPAEPFDADLELSNGHHFGTNQVALHDPIENIYYPMFKTDYAAMTQVSSIIKGRVSGRFGFVKRNTKFGIEYLNGKSSPPVENEVAPKDFGKLVDLMLEVAGVPRSELFEYPVNEFESRDRIAKAEKAALKSLEILKLKVAKN